MADETDKTADVGDRTRSPPSFKKQLRLQDFMFTGSCAVRRSPRLSTPAGASPAPGSGPMPVVPLPKRKALTDAGESTGAESAPSSSRSPRKRQKSGYAPPSTYAHLPLLPDAIAPNLIVLFVGLNPGIQTARTGHAYAHPTNKFWPLLHTSGVTPRLCSPTEDGDMPRLFNLGLTNIVSRPSRNGAELSKQEMDAGVAILESKARRWRPESMCVVGKSIWESLWRVRHGRAIKPSEFRYGWQDECENIGKIGKGGPRPDEVEEGVNYSEGWKGARIFVATSTSGLAATLSLQEKQQIWRQLGSWVEERREQREASSEEAG
ncbi:hypothetical protein OQA88_3983 [Cercophora sp. LCS_1]